MASPAPSAYATRALPHGALRRRGSVHAKRTGTSAGLLSAPKSGGQLLGPGLCPAAGGVGNAGPAGRESAGCESICGFPLAAGLAYFAAPAAWAEDDLDAAVGVVVGVDAERAAETAGAGAAGAPSVDASELLIGVAFYVAMAGLIIITVGVIYLSYKDFVDRQEEEAARKAVDASLAKKATAGKPVANTTRATPLGFGAAPAEAAKADKAP